MIRIAHNPNRTLFLIALTMLLLTTTRFTPPLFAAEQQAVDRSLVIDCQHRHVSQRDAGWLLGTDNVSHAYARRAQLYADVARACAAGSTAVRVQASAWARPDAAQARR